MEYRYQSQRKCINTKRRITPPGKRSPGESSTIRWRTCNCCRSRGYHAEGIRRGTRTIPWRTSQVATSTMPKPPHLRYGWGSQSLQTPHHCRGAPCPNSLLSKNGRTKHVRSFETNSPSTRQSANSLEPTVAQICSISKPHTMSTHGFMPCWNTL